MSLPDGKRKRNNYFKVVRNISMDTTSILFMTLEALLGLNRLSVIKKHGRCFTILTNAYTFFFNATVFLMLLLIFKIEGIVGIKIGTACIEYMLCTILSFVLSSRLELYYKDLNAMDEIAACRKISGLRTKVAIIFSVVTVTTIYGVFFAYYNTRSLFYLLLHVLPLRTIHVLELHFYGHLLGILLDRMLVLNLLVSKTFSNNVEEEADREFISLPTNTDETDTDENQTIKIRKLINLYQNINNAFYHLIEAIKWQLINIVTMSFISSICISYQITIGVICGDMNGRVGTIISYTVMCVGNAVPLCVPCLIGDRLRGEVQKLRSMLASHLHDLSINKEERMLTRSLLSLSETRDLSFTLLGMITVDCALPLKYLSLVVTYVIILLQFDKVINPSAN